MKPNTLRQWAMAAVGAAFLTLPTLLVLPSAQALNDPERGHVPGYVGDGVHRHHPGDRGSGR